MVDATGAQGASHFHPRQVFKRSLLAVAAQPLFIWSQKSTIMPRQHRDPIRGNQVTIISGIYFNNEGAWINEAEGDKGFTAEKVYVLVKMKDKDKLRGVRLNKDTVSTKYKARVDPQNYDEAVLDQHFVLRKAMNELAKKIAKYEIDDPTVYAKIFLEMLNDAKKNRPYRTVWGDLSMPELS
jgi:hypothetical protein